MVKTTNNDELQQGGCSCLTTTNEESSEEKKICLDSCDIDMFTAEPYKENKQHGIEIVCMDFGDEIYDELEMKFGKPCKKYSVCDSINETTNYDDDEADPDPGTMSVELRPGEITAACRSSFHTMIIPTATAAKNNNTEK